MKKMPPEDLRKLFDFMIELHLDNIDGSAEDEAMRIVSVLADKFGWSTRIHTRWEADNTAEMELGRELTDEEWDKVKATNQWQELSYVDQEESLEATYEALRAAGVV